MTVWIGLAAIGALSPGAVAWADEGLRTYPEQHRHRHAFPRCPGDSPVVGRSDCRRFAPWALPRGLPRLQMSVGGSVRVLGDHGLDLGEAAEGRERVFAEAPSTDRAGGPSGAALTFDWRITGELARHLYTGVDVSVGSARIDDPAQERAYGIELGEERGMYYAAGAIAGLLFVGGPLVLRGEVVGGARLIEVPIEYEGSDTPTRTSVTQPIVEPRVAAELWLTPWVTLGARAGTDLLREGDYMVGLYFALYGRAYDGSRRRPLPVH